ncbi:hypothetical protein Ancab_031513 [Ancistrocladus abbreviatus]
MPSENRPAPYYPPYPPPPVTTRLRIFPVRTRGGTGCCCLDCLCDCGCCVLSCVLQIIFSILIFIGLIILVFWLIVHPHVLKFHTTDASLTQFSLSSNSTANSNNTLLFNLSLNFTVRNPNRHIGVYFDQIEINAYYHDQSFSTASLDPFYQGHKNKTDLGPVVFKGQSTLVVGSDLVSDYDGEKSNGVFEIDVTLHLKVRFKLGLFKTGRYKPKVECDLKIPLSGGNATSSSSSGQSFQATKCHYDL